MRLSLAVCRPVVLALVMSVLVAGTAFAAGQAAADKAATEKAESLKIPELKYEKYTLPNGLVVLTHEDHKLPLVAVDLWYHVGPLNERAGRTGFAHLFEHMMFEGSEHAGEKAHIKYVEGAGATDVNGTTNFDRTSYFETMPSNQLELALWLESDRMGFLLEGLDREKLANQRDVVRNERRQGEGRPYSVANERVYQLLFPKGHPYFGNVIGSHADIEAARINDIRQFHQQFYTPNNASIAIAGDFDPVQLKKLLTKYFGPIPAGPKVAPVTTATVPTPPILQQKRETVTDTVKLEQLDIGFLTPPAYAPGEADTDLLTYVLGQSSASRLYEALVHKREMAQSALCFNRSLKLSSVLFCSLTAKPGVKLDDLEAAFWDEVGKLQKDGPTQDELDSARTSNLTAKITGLQRLGGFGGVADVLNGYNQYTGDPGYLSKDLARYQAITTTSMRDVAAKYLKKNRAVVVSCVPGLKVIHDVGRSAGDVDKDVKLVAPYKPDFEKAQDWRKEVPKPGSSSNFHLPVPTTFTLKNGLPVYLIQDSALPVVSATVISRAGGETNPVSKPGIADFSAAMLSQGTTTRSATQIAEEAEKLGTRLSVFANMDGTNAGVTVLNNHADEALDLLSDVLQHPAFKEDELERIRKRRMLSIQQEGDSVAAIAARVGPKLVYGNTPYGFTMSGTVDSVQKVSRAEIQNFWASQYGPEDSALVLAGDLTEEQAHALAEKHFGAWQGTAKGVVQLPPPPAEPSLKVVIVDKPGSPQTALYAYGLGVPVTAPDLPAVRVMNYTLGGSFGSRINMNLREVHGYTYGANSRYSLYREGGPFAAGGLVKTDVTAPSAKELLAELKRIQTELPSAEELKMAKEASIQSLPAQFETTNATAAAMSSIFLYNRPLDYYATLPEAFRAVTAEDVAMAAKTDVHPDHLIFVAVGDKVKIEPGLKELNLAPIEYVDVSGNPVK